MRKLCGAQTLKKCSAERKRQRSKKPQVAALSSVTLLLQGGRGLLQTSWSDGGSEEGESCEAEASSVSSQEPLPSSQ